VPVVSIGRAVTDSVPRQYDHSRRPLPQTRLLVSDRRSADETCAGLGDVSMRIDEDDLQIREVVRLAVEQEKARLRRDRHANRVGHLEPAAALECLLGEEHPFAVRCAFGCPTSPSRCTVLRAFRKRVCSSSPMSSRLPSRRTPARRSDPNWVRRRTVVSW
jgi:hypothetical protein